MMHTGAFDLEIPTIEPKSRCRLKAKFTDPEGGNDIVQGLVLQYHFGVGGIENRRDNVPSDGLRDGQFQLKRLGGFGLDCFDGRCALGDNLPIGPVNQSSGQQPL